MDSKRAGYLLGDLCSRLGLCLSPEDWNRLEAHPSPDPDDFALAVFEAEKLDPDAVPGLYDQVLDLVHRYWEESQEAIDLEVWLRQPRPSEQRGRRGGGRG